MSTQAAKENAIALEGPRAIAAILHRFEERLNRFEAAMEAEKCQCSTSTCSSPGSQPGSSSATSPPGGYPEKSDSGGEPVTADREAIPYAKSVVAERAEFKNFHRLLCERFRVAHDEKDWKRDQLSLIESIAQQLAAKDAEIERLKRAIERALRTMSGDPDSRIDWNSVDELLMSYAKQFDGLVDQRAEIERQKRTTDDITAKYNEVCRDVSRCREELQSIDNVLGNRAALDGHATRALKVQHIINVAKSADQHLATIDRLNADRDALRESIRGAEAAIKCLRLGTNPSTTPTDARGSTPTSRKWCDKVYSATDALRARAKVLDGYEVKKRLLIEGMPSGLFGFNLPPGDVVLILTPVKPVPAGGEGIAKG